MNKKILSMIEELFLLKLQDKNSWGKNEVAVLYKDCVITILKEFID